MDFKIVDTSLETLFQEIRRRINRLQSGGTIDSLITIGANIENQIGASFVSLKQLASRYTANESLALLLWNEQKREEQIVACLLLPENINKEKITQLLHTCLNYEIAEYFGSLYLHRHNQMLDITASWLESNNAYLQIASLTALSRYIILHKEEVEIAENFYQNIVQREFKERYVQLLAERYRQNR